MEDNSALYKIQYSINEENNIILEEQPQDNFSANSVMELMMELIHSGLSISDDDCHIISNNIHLNKNEYLDSETATNLFTEVLLSKVPSIWIEYMRKTGLLNFILPELLEAYGCEQNEFHLYDVYYHLLNSCDNAERQLDIRMSALFHDIGKPRSKRRKKKEGDDISNTFYGHEIIGARMFKRIMNRFNYDKNFIDRITKLIRYHMFHYTHDWTDNAVRRFIKNVGDDFLKELFLLREADRRGSGKKTDTCDEIEAFKGRIEDIKEYDKAPKVTDLVIGGNEIISRYDIKPGPIIGEMLRYLLEQTVSDPSLNREDALYELLDEYLKNNQIK